MIWLDPGMWLCSWPSGSNQKNLKNLQRNAKNSPRYPKNEICSNQVCDDAADPVVPASGSHNHILHQVLVNCYPQGESTLSSGPIPIILWTKTNFQNYLVDQNHALLITSSSDGLHMALRLGLPCNPCSSSVATSNQVKVIVIISLHIGVIILFIIVTSFHIDVLIISVHIVVIILFIIVIIPCRKCPHWCHHQMCPHRCHHPPSRPPFMDVWKCPSAGRVVTLAVDKYPQVRCCNFSITSKHTHIHTMRKSSKTKKKTNTKATLAIDK